MPVDARTAALVEASSRVVLSASADPREDIAAERRRARFDSQEVAEHLNGGKDNLQRTHALIEKISKTDWGDKTKRYFLTRDQEYVGGLKAAFGIWELMKQEGLDLQDGLIMRKELFWPGGLELHIGMFIPTILSQGTPEQQSHWLPQAYNLQIIGTYAQTELGHGTFVRGLETTATYDPHTQEFVVHSPSLTSTKWWPGGLGKTSTHVVLMARLFVGGQDHGPHSFIVQIRCLDRHLPLPGVTVGDIGPKFGYNGVDNGFLAFDHVRIPREHMLMRFAQVRPDGSYSAPPPANAKASYATMVYVRATIVEDAGSILARAATIAVRYNAVRRQMSPSGPGQRELQVIDYQNSSYTLFPLVASAYALIFMGKSMMQMYKGFEKSRDKGDFSILPELHALSSGLKAICTWVTSDGIEACRRCCGGHGYSLLSGLPTLYASYVQNVTWEGDNNVMCLQTARYLVKTLVAARSGAAVSGSASYLGEAAAQPGSVKCGVGSADDWMDLDTQVAALRQRALSRCRAATATLLAACPGGRLVFEGEPWNGSTVELIRAARAHCLLVLHANFVDALRAAGQQQQLSVAALAALSRLAVLHGLSLLERDLAESMEDGYMSGRQASLVRAALYRQLREVRPDAVALVDGFGISDYLLNSALGRKDGDVYQALYDMAQHSPLNDSQEGPAWEPVLEAHLKQRSKL